MTAEHHRTRTGPKPRFTREQAVQVALEIGIEQFTLGQVAQRLGVSPPSLYRVAASREELQDACLQRIVHGMALSGGVSAISSWQEALRHLAQVLWQAMEDHPGLDRVVLQRPEAFVHLSEPLRAFLEHVLALGFPRGRSQLLRAVDFIADTVHATHLTVARLRDVDESGQRVVDRLAEELREEASAHGAEVLYEADPSWTERGFLDGKVAFIIAGLEAGVQL